jgi:hypothetical protein
LAYASACPLKKLKKSGIVVPIQTKTPKYTGISIMAKNTNIGFGNILIKRKK